MISSNPNPVASSSAKNIVKTIVHKTALLSFVSITILSTAASCNWNPFASNSGNNNLLGGMLKQDPSIKANSFGKINAVKAINGKTDPEGLTGLSVLKTVQINKDLIYILTQQKGVFKTIDAGKSWQRVYVFPVVYTEEKDKQKELENSLKRNDDLVVTNFWVQADKPNIVYISAKDNNVGKIFKTIDGGKTSKEIYASLSSEASSVDFVVMNPNSDDIVYALMSKNTLIQTSDGGKTWQRINDPLKDKDRIIQIGILPMSQQFYILSEKNGLSTSIDAASWSKVKLSKTKADAVVEQPEDTKLQKIQRKVLPTTLPAFKQFQKIIPISPLAGETSTDKAITEPAILLADKEIWFTDDLNTGSLTQIKNIPIEGDKIQIQDVAVDPILGIQKIYVASGSRLLVSENSGQTWANKKINVEGIGTISRITIDKTNPEILYLALRK